LLIPGQRGSGDEPVSWTNEQSEFDDALRGQSTSVVPNQTQEPTPALQLPSTGAKIERMSVLEQPRELAGQRYRWRLAARVAPAELGALAGFDPLLAQLLWNRGLREASAIERFLQAEAAPLGDPTRMAG